MREKGVRIGRRRFMVFLASGAAFFCRPFGAAGAPAASGEPGGGRIPVLMFHKVGDRPHSPEEISPPQLARLFDFIWAQGFAPLNMSDILRGRVDEVLPAGRMALGITVDDSHPSVFFSRGEHSQALNSVSFMDIFTESAARAGLDPRAALFLSGSSYFGGSRGLGFILEQLAPTPGIEFGYHTRRHFRMRGFGYEQTRRTVNEQIEDFRRRGVLERVSRILAYPYGLAPAPDGIRALADMGFYGGLSAFPGADEAGSAGLPPACRYGRDGLMSDPFHVPRVNVGSFIYAPRSGYAPIDPVNDFRKDVGAFSDVYRAGG